jgi:PAS domain S-box-containing protein
MKIHKKTGIVLAAAFVLIVAALFFHSRTLLLDSYVRLDEERVYDDVQRLNSAVDNELSQMKAVSRDWSSWDDTYEFITDRNEDYITTNLVDDSFLNLSLNLMVFVNPLGEIVYSKAYDLQDEVEVALPDSFQQHLYPADATLLNHTDSSSSVTGVLMLPEGPILVSSNPILTSDDQGPIRGTLIFGRYLDENAIATLAERTLLSLDVIPFADGESLPNFSEVQPPLLEDTIFVSPLSSESASGYSLVRDIYGEPALIMEVDESRTIYQQGLTSVNYFIIFIVAVGLLFSALIYFLMDRLILSRLARLNAMVSDVGKKKGLSTRLSLPGNDELSDLADAMNTTFRELAIYHQALADSEQKYSTLVEGSTDGIIVIQDGLLKFANQKIAEMTGFSIEEAMGEPFLTFVSPEYQESAADAYKRRMAGEKVPGIYELEVFTKDGGKKVFEVNANSIQYEGKPADMVILRDVSERKQIQERLVITDRLASVGELASGIAHELNNPLTGVLGFSQLLRDKNIPDDAMEDVEMVHREAQRAAQVVRNLLTFARKHPSEKQMQNINFIIGKALELRTYEQNVNNVQVKSHLAPDLPEIMVDYFQLQQVFLNIIINAEYFMKEAHGEGTLTITTEKVGDYVRVSFADDGPGIAKADVGHLFDPFFTTKGVGKGTGLGLSICHGIIAEHGGRIYAQSQLGKGATFVVELPIKVKENKPSRKGTRRKK